MKEKREEKYQNIMRATSIFGGVQLINIIINIVRSKYIATLLGPSGMGVMGLFTSAITIISSLTNFGLGVSAIKDISLAHSSDNNEQISKVVTVFKRLVIFTGLLGTIIFFIISPWLSSITFGSSNYTLAFYWISFTLIINQLTTAQMVILQGMQKIHYLAQANLFGSLAALIINIPLYYIFRINGIAIGIISSSIIALIISWLYSNKIAIPKINISAKDVFIEGKSMLKMGFIISLNSILSVGFAYILRIYITRFGGLEQVGLFNAGFAIINTYVGLVFAAMATDYYPRLCAIAHNNVLCKETINQQADVGILIISPIIVFFIIFIYYIINILYSNQFIKINGMLYWSAIGMFFKTVSWSISYLLLAKASSKIFIINELAAHIYIMIFNLIGYYLMGLTGLGISFAFAYFIYMLQVYIFSKRYYGFSFDSSFLLIFIVQFIIALLAIICINYIIYPYSYFVGCILIFISLFYSIYELNKRFDLKIFIKNLYYNMHKEV